MASGGFQRPLKNMVVKHTQSNPFIPTPDERTPVALGSMLCLCLALAVLCLAGFHLYLVTSAQSTIEFHGNFAKRKKPNWKNPYSAGGWKKNWEMVYGTHNSSCCGILMAMMPSNREPEFLPLPINGVMVRRRRRSKSISQNVDEDVNLGVFQRRRRNEDDSESDDESDGDDDGGETDIEMGSSEATTNGTNSQETEFLMRPKDTNGPSFRARASKA